VRDNPRPTSHHADVTGSYNVGIDLPYDLQRDLITLQVGAELAGVSRATVEKWMRRGYRHPTTGKTVKLTDHGTSGAPRVLGIEVLQAEAATRARAGRRPYPHQRRSDM
jgi:hypothetical protein